jgi:hypothetical protein
VLGVRGVGYGDIGYGDMIRIAGYESRRIGAEYSGKTPGSDGKLPVGSCIAPARSRIACWPLVMLYKLHMGRLPCSRGRLKDGAGEIGPDWKPVLSCENAVWPPRPGNCRYSEPPNRE